MGGSTASKMWVLPQCIIASATTGNNNNTNDESSVYFNSVIINSVVSNMPTTQKHCAILDSGATNCYHKNNPNPTYIQQAQAL